MLSLDTLKVKDGTGKRSRNGSNDRACAPEAMHGIVGEPKLDGLSVSLTYQDGALTQEARRYATQALSIDVTQQILHGIDIPTSLSESFTGDVRGEVIVPVSFFRLCLKVLAVSGPKPRCRVIKTKKRLGCHRKRFMFCRA